MKDKEKQIEEMASDMDYGCTKRDLYPSDAKEIAKSLYLLGYRKLPEDSVVLSREEINNADYFYVKDGELIPVEKGRGKFITTEWYTELLMKMPLGHELAKERKETAEKIICLIKTFSYDKEFTKIITRIIAERFGVEIKE